MITDIVTWFFWVWRKDGTSYIDHLVQTLKNTIKYDETFDHDSVLIALLHDSIEDTNETFETLQSKYGNIVALWVSSLSKKPFWEYIPQWNNDNNEWTEEAKNFSQVKTSIEDFIWKKIDHDFKLSNHSQLPDDLKSKWETYEDKYKEIRNDDYFSKFQSLETLKRSIQEEAEIREISISEWELDLLTHKVVTVKLADRLHNIVTLPSEKMKRKIDETVYYLKDIWKEIWGQLWQRISREIVKLEATSKKKLIMSAIQT